LISFRYHLVSIVAVFLAIGVGVLIGTTVLDQGIVSRLEATTQQLSDTADQLRAEVGDLKSQVGRYQASLDRALPALIDGRLADTEVVLVTHQDIDDGVLAEARRALDSAGATVVATLAADDRMWSEDPAVSQELAGILGVPPDAQVALSEAAGVAMADRLADGVDPAADPATDLLFRLLSGGFLLEGDLTADELGGVGTDGQAVIVLGGTAGEAQPAANPDVFLVSLVEGLVGRAVPTGAGEGFLSDGFVSVVRSTSDVAGSDDLVTVDDVNEPSGGAALVLGLDDLLTFGVGGHYGFKDGATAPFPTP
jgi:Copper transport outer membrane protein, MctB